MYYYYDEYYEADRKAALASVGVPCGKPHRTPKGLVACGEAGAGWCPDCVEEAGECLALLRHC